MNSDFLYQDMSHNTVFLVVKWIACSAVFIGGVFIIAKTYPVFRKQYKEALKAWQEAKSKNPDNKTAQ